MPKKIDPALRDRAVRLVREHRSEYPSLTAASAAVARQVGVGHESVRRWVLQSDIDDGTRDGVTSVEHAEIKKLKAENTRLREDVAILRAATSFFVGELDPRTYRAWGAVLLLPEQSPTRRSWTRSETRRGRPSWMLQGSTSAS